MSGYLRSGMRNHRELNGGTAADRDLQVQARQEHGRSQPTAAGFQLQAYEAAKPARVAELRPPQGHTQVQDQAQGDSIAWSVRVCEFSIHKKSATSAALFRKYERKLLLVCLVAALDGFAHTLQYTLDFIGKRTIGVKFEVLLIGFDGARRRHNFTRLLINSGFAD